LPIPKKKKKEIQWVYPNAEPEAGGEKKKEGGKKGKK
jgi:hypothetical protein